MDWNIVFAILGILLTVVLWLLGRQYRYPGELVFLNQSCIGLFDSVVNRFPSISINFQESPIGHRIFYFKGFLANIGIKDITPEMVERNVHLKAPEGTKWLEANIASGSTAVQAEVLKLDDQTLDFKMGLFRRKEYVQVEALIEVVGGESCKEMHIEADDLLEKLSLSHRISDTKEIKMTNYLNVHKSKKQLFSEFSGQFIILAIGLILSYFSFSNFINFDSSKPENTNYIFPTKDGKIFEGEKLRIKQGLIIVKSAKKGSDLELSLEDFVKQYPEWEKKPIYPRESSKWMFLFLSIVLGVLTMRICYEVFRSFFESWRIAGIFK